MLHTGYEKEYYPLPGHPITDDELADLEPHRGENEEYATLGANIFTHLGVGPSLCGALLPLGSSGYGKWNTPGTAIR